MKTHKDIDSYIKDFPKETQALLKKMRATIRKAAPKATEKIGYGIPTYQLNGNLVHFGGFKTHIGFFPGGGARAVFPKELSKYEGGKGTVQFPLDKSLPLGLVTKIVKFRIKENVAKKKK
jgi:uncharacterized protein YdhG (YjbR/CyaY superfamily)